jgi:4'-phosphopantetheinyl transferase
VDFNVSHTHDVALFGVLHDARAARIGVDVERLERRINAPGVARKFLSEREREALSTLDAEQARRQVLALWTCKEAMSKATGDALSAPFSRIDIDVARTPTVRAGPGVYRPGPWTLHRAGLQDRYVATVAIWRR